MRVTVMSPVTADVSIAQVGKWLADSGWKLCDVSVHELVFDVWSNDSASDLYLVSVPKPHVAQYPEECSAYLASAIKRIATATKETPAFVLQEMALTKL